MSIFENYFQYVLIIDIIQLLHAEFDEVNVDYNSRKNILHGFFLLANVYIQGVKSALKVGSEKHVCPNISEIMHYREKSIT